MRAPAHRAPPSPTLRRRGDVLISQYSDVVNYLTYGAECAARAAANASVLILHGAHTLHAGVVYLYGAGVVHMRHAEQRALHRSTMV